MDVEVEEYLRFHSTADRQAMDLPASYWAAITDVSQVFKELEASHKTSIRDQSQLFYHRIQKCLITNDLQSRALRYLIAAATAPVGCSLSSLCLQVLSMS